MKVRSGGVIGAIIVAIVLTAAHDKAALSPGGDRALYTPRELSTIFRHSPLPPLSPDPTDRVAASPRAAALGHFLFFDSHLSANGEISCASCHRPTRAFTDGRALAKGLAIGTRNTPTVLNAAYNHWYFWDGRTDSLWSQALQPFENPREMGTDRLHVVHVVDAETAFRKAYERMFGPLPLADDTRPPHARPDPNPRVPVARAWTAMAPADRTAVNRVYSNLGKAIEAYERELVGANSAFDHYVAALRTHDAAKETVISAAAKRGLKLFVGAGNCELCHSGPAFTDGQFHNLGLPLQPGEAADPGRAAGIRFVRADRFDGAGPFSDDPKGAAKERLSFLPPSSSQLGTFKTPSLRNVAVTAPYMHDGRFASLKQVLDFYAKGKAASRGRLVGTREATADLIPHLTAHQEADLIAFLKTLTSAPLPRSLTQPPRRP